jgi:hypothetical protein
MDKQGSSDTVQKMLAVLGITAGLGAAGRGLQGVANLAKPKRNYSPMTEIRAPMPYLAEEEDEEEVSKYAEAPWWQIPAVAGAGAAGLYGGYKGMDMLLDNQRTKGHEDELEKAKKEFYQAMLERSQKQGSDDSQSLGGTLDRLFDAVQEKQSFAGLPSWNEAKGGYATYVGASALISGLMMHDMMQKKTRRSLMEKAKQERERKRFERTPPSVRLEPSAIASAHAK